MTKKKSKITGPTMLTIFRMLLVIPFMISCLMEGLAPKIVALTLFSIAAITDKIDGNWARKTHQVTDMGAFLDPLADKMLVDLAFLVLVYMGIIPIWMFAVIIVRDLAVDGMRMMAARDGITIAASMWGKVKTTFQMITLIAILANTIFGNECIGIVNNILLYVSIALTIISGLDYLVKGWKKVIR